MPQMSSTTDLYTNKLDKNNIIGKVNKLVVFLKILVSIKTILSKNSGVKSG